MLLTSYFIFFPDLQSYYIWWARFVGITVMKINYATMVISEYRTVEICTVAHSCIAIQSVTLWSKVDKILPSCGWVKVAAQGTSYLDLG